jgi:hypothetical protein
MIKIRMFADFCSSEQLIKNYTNSLGLEKDYSKKYGFQFVADDSYTHALIMNTVMPKLTCPKENVIGFAYEPYDILKNTFTKFIPYAQKHISKYYIGLQRDLPELFIEGYPYMCHRWKRDLKKILKNKKRQYVMSMIASSKNYLEGHKYRHKLIKKLLKTKMNIHIYGRNLESLYNDKRIKGTFDNYEPYDNYQYSICLENSLSNDYISEKYTTCIISNTIPLYYGAKNVNKYFGDSWGYRLTGKIKNDIELITKIYNNPEKHKISLTKAIYNNFKGEPSLIQFLKKEFIIN